MKLYRHYKNKLYKLIGIAKHSETLEDLVIYECLYPNAMARVWARPEPMFFGTIEASGRKVARFSPVALELERVERIMASDWDRLEQLGLRILERWQTREAMQERLRNTRHLLLLAKLDQTPVAFKLGYEDERDSFYSWLGGVLPEYRKLGIARALLEEQLVWCQANHYKRVRTSTYNHYRDMLILNLKAGFQVVATEESPQGPKILLERDLTSAPK